MSILVQISQHTDGRRWWILRRGDRAVSLTAVVIPDGTCWLTDELADQHHARLLPDCVSLHTPGDDPDCPALVGPCVGDRRQPGARELLAAWAATGHDDQVIAAGLAAVATREWGAP